MTTLRTHDGPDRAQTPGVLLACLIVAAGLFGALPACAQQGGADLNISPKRVVFDPATRTATVYVLNRGTASGSYTVELEDRVMSPEGQILAIGEATKDEGTKAAAAKVQSAKSLVTFTPRRVTLEPGASQVIRLRVLRPADLPAGEYRTHLSVTTVPPEDTGLTAEQAAKPEAGQLAFRVVSLFSLSIPLIVRQGDATATVTLENPKVSTEQVVPPEGGAPTKASVLTMDLLRAGVGSVYGNIEVKAGKGGDVVGSIRGLAVYPEIDRRATRLTLTRAPAPGEKLTVTFTDDDRHPGTVLATGVLTAP